MNITNGQSKVLNKLHPNINKETVKVICEAGSELNEWYKGIFFIEYKEGRNKKRLKIDSESFVY